MTTIKHKMMFFYYDMNGIKHGPFQMAELRLLVNEQVVTPRTILETEDGQQELANQFEELFPHEQCKTTAADINSFETTYCKNCGNEILDFGKVCTRCGHLITSEFTNDAQEPVIDTCLIDSILVTILCCFPLGIVSIIFSALASGAIAHGDYKDAAAKAKVAQTLNTVAIILFFALILVMWILHSILSNMDIHFPIHWSR